MAGPPLATAEEEEEHNEHDLRFLSTFSVSQMLFGTVFDIRIDFCLGLGEVTVPATRARFTGRLGKL